jgi:HD-like signal output (HDOD) protein
MCAQSMQPTNVAAPRRTAGSAANREASSNRPEAAKKTAAIFRRDAAQSSALAAKLNEAGIGSVTLESPDALRGLLSGTQMDLLILDNEMDGFFSGFEVIRKLRASLVRVPAILLSHKSESASVDANAAGAVTIVDAAADPADIAKAAFRILDLQSNNADGIPDRARAIVERQTDLPVLSQLTVQLLHFLEMPPDQVPMTELVRLISIDPRATAVLLKSANASTNGMSREISNVAEAARVLGVRPSIGRVLNAAITTGMGALGKGLPTELQIWQARRGMLIASVTSSFGKELEGRSDEAAFLIGVLQDVGIMGLIRGFPKQYQGALKRWRTVGHLKLPALEQADLGCTHAEISAAMMERWGMPASFIPAVLHHLKPVETVARLGIDRGLHRVMSIAEAVADMIELPHPSRRFVLNNLFADYGAEKAALCLRSLGRAAEKASEAFQLLALPLPKAEQLESMVRSTINEALSPSEFKTETMHSVSG